MDKKLTKNKNPQVGKENKKTFPVKDSTKGKSRRDFITLTTCAMAGIGAASSFWPLIKSMSPSAEVLAMSTVEVNLTNIQEGQEKKVKWQGKPVFIRRRTKQEIEIAKAVDIRNLRDPELDEQRVHKGKSEWLIMIGICTHLGCVPINHATKDGNGWFCPCHGSYYDTSGRVIGGPAPKNMAIPNYFFLSENVVVIGKKA
ncbi:ubiquinol-cytochrome c reductase iron-sulfur subunit [Wolbachia endosymbiont of Dirofilaria (Dirofilaria) immitis]|uniref:ubiquinol-cytochrome c reductase iron-sulfur subunit n=1 Tax=Wolbachia endosymbiont of Dirofilaria (Dirofilaria) immitis TaxID=1812115 RepID=UPI00158B83E8|nr:ubiquinol-cytochrome c reductase iron-sulfur subunit [Wolbachia endosymbiont of Dirofilaria (Dirofilaria) immitis]QKX02645.1 ubiquinol-cytochrome c reductase iron-sulfur subunit [Wolbachia endosymbiont of Dirofilaria (Dirofilaria) immitis]